MIRILGTALALTLCLHFPTAWAGKPGESPGRTRTTIERMDPARLEAAHEDVSRHQASRVSLGPFANLNDYRAILHAHAEDSAHTGGTRPEMLEDAKKTGVKVIMLSDHFRPPRDFMDGWRGLREGVLFIPGSESQGFLLYPEASIFDAMKQPKEALVQATTAGSGLIFLSHVEERMDHSMDGLTGMEIYNRHADANDDMDLLFAVARWATDPVEVAKLQESLRLYPSEILATQLDYPQDYLAKWDAETLSRRVVGIAANDCHHNQVFVVKVVDAETVLLGTVVDDDEDMRTVTAKQSPGVAELAKGKAPGDIVVKLDFDPYERSFLNVSTHILAPELTENAIRAALSQGHAYVSHDWMCDPTGFRFYVPGEDGPALIMGDEAKLDEPQKLIAEAPLKSSMRLLKNGKVIKEKKTKKLEFTAKDPGVYRVEAWLEVDGEDRIWIYSNPIYLR